MGKGKYKRKRERAQKHAQHEISQAGPLKSEVVHTQQETPSESSPNPKGKDKKYWNQPRRKPIKASKPTGTDSSKRSIAASKLLEGFTKN
jgi:hypothetical protein